MNEKTPNTLLVIIVVSDEARARYFIRNICQFADTNTKFKYMPNNVGVTLRASLVVLVGGCCGISRRCRHVGECWRSMTLKDVIYDEL